MTPVSWPAGLPGNQGQIRKDGFQPLPADNMRVSDMEDGAKSARKFTIGWSKHKGVWRFSLGEFAIFKAFVRDELKDGIRPFTYNPPLSSYTVAAYFVPQEGGRAYVPSPGPGANMFVNFEVRFLDRALS
ncbi:hypothetical protein DES40_1716 [Litorimonas taeanensis]|uniref:Phage-related protein n=1 Tax=Litorimonas taeanensis TaxID=568099 RepID=A0A420WDE3_9PROT|nr:hypothetical protein [Litorimonas taeanensis]RKQ68940.1 hypothetical protein DES40_1716 [Litorimonas taeanensis]